MSSAGQNYYGVRCVVSVSGDNKEYARELIARNHGFSAVPPVDVDVTEDTDESTFTKFLYDSCGTAFADIIENMVLTGSKDKIRYIFKETETEVDATDEQKEYLMANYKKEVEAKIEALKKEPREEVIVSVDESETIEGGSASRADDPKHNSADPSRMHIPDDNFLETSTPDRPINVTATEETLVNPLDATGMFNPVQPSQYFMPDISNEIYVQFPYLKDLESKIVGKGQFKVGFEWASGLLKVKVAAADKPNVVLDNFSLTLDLNGYVVTSGAKWWPGVNHKNPVDFQKAYKYDLEAIEKYLSGEGVPDEFVCFNDQVATLNKSVDLRTVFNVQGMTDEDAKYIFGKMQDNLKKLNSRINKECPNARFRMSDYSNKDNFELEAASDVYTNIGGKVANTAGAAAYKIQVAGNKAPKLFK